MAAILDDAWTAPAIVVRYPTTTWRTEYRSLRAVLLDWLGDMAHDVGDETARLASNHGFLMDEEHMSSPSELLARRYSMRSSHS